MTSRCNDSTLKGAIKSHCSVRLGPALEANSLTWSQVLRISTAITVKFPEYRFLFVPFPDTGPFLIVSSSFISVFDCTSDLLDKTPVVSRAVSTNILHFFERVVVFTCPDRLTAAPPRLLRALLIGGDPKADDQSHDHGPSSATLGPPAARAGPPHRGPDHRD